MYEKFKLFFIFFYSEDLFAELGGTGTEGSSEEEGEVATRRPRRKCKKPDLYGDWEYEREEESE